MLRPELVNSADRSGTVPCRSQFLDGNEVNIYEHAPAKLERKNSANPKHMFVQSLEVPNFSLSHYRTEKHCVFLKPQDEPFHTGLSTCNPSAEFKHPNKPHSIPHLAEQCRFHRVTRKTGQIWAAEEWLQEGSPEHQHCGKHVLKWARCSFWSTLLSDSQVGKRTPE